MKKEESKCDPANGKEKSTTTGRTQLLCQLLRCKDIVSFGICNGNSENEYLYELLLGAIILYIENEFHNL